MQGYIEKHLLGMTSLLPPCVGSVRLCPKSHVFGISCHAKHTVQQDCMSISWLCWQTLCYQDATFWWVESKFFFFFLHTLLVIKAKMKILKIPLLFLQHTIIPELHGPIILPESLLFQVWQQLPLHEQHPSHCSNSHTAPRPREVWSAKIIWQQEEIPHLLDEDVVCRISQGLRWSSPSKSTIWRTVSHPWIRR